MTPSTTVPASTFLVHVSSSESREIHAFAMDSASGDLRLLEVMRVPGNGAPTRGNIPLAWGLGHRVLYAHTRVAPYPLAAFALDPVSGTLRRIQTVDLPAAMTYLSVSMDGQSLMGASYDHAVLTVHRLQADGRVAMPGVQVLPSPPKAHCILEAFWGKYVYATSVDGDAILVFRRDPVSGRLEAVASVSTRPGTGPRHLAFHPTLDRLYCVGEHAGSVEVFAVDKAFGGLEALHSETLMSPGFAGNALAADIHVAPDGRFVYCCVRTTDEVVQFAVDGGTGLLARAGAFTVQPFPRGFAIAPGGRFLLCAGQANNSLGVYAIDPVSGGLALAGLHAVGKRPGWVSIIPAPSPLRG